MTGQTTPLDTPRADNPMQAVVSECPHCGNTWGFTFGTCSMCGFNYLDNAFHWILVHPDNLPSDCMYLIDTHARITKR